MKELEYHKIEGYNGYKPVFVADEPCAGGACHSYILGIEPKRPPSEKELVEMWDSEEFGNAVKALWNGNFEAFKQEQSKRMLVPDALMIDFQNGAINEHGHNGITNEQLCSILIHRMEGFQSGNFACKSNQIALEHFQAGLAALQSRTKDRIEKGIEGTQKQQCQDCKKNFEGLHPSTCPYRMELENEREEILVCDDCYDERRKNANENRHRKRTFENCL